MAITINLMAISLVNILMAISLVNILGLEILCFLMPMNCSFIYLMAIKISNM